MADIHIVREHALKILHMSDLVIDRLRADFDGPVDASLALQRRARETALARMVHGLQDVHALSAWDSEGELLASSDARSAVPAMNPGGRECFARLREGGADPCVSSPFVGAGPSDGLLVVARRREAASGLDRARLIVRAVL